MSRTILAAIAACVLCAPLASAGTGKELHCHPEQRDQFRTTQERVERLWLRARRATQAAAREEMSQLRAQGYRDALRADFSDCWRAHERFASSLHGRQRAVLSTRLNNLETIRSHVLRRFDQLDAAVRAEAPDASFVRERFEEIGDEVKDWRRQYRKMERHLQL